MLGNHVRGTGISPKELQLLLNAASGVIQSFGGKKPFVRPGCRWNDNIKIDIKRERIRVWAVFIWTIVGNIGGFL
jgi:hypothetical protein